MLPAHAGNYMSMHKMDTVCQMSNHRQERTALSQSLGSLKAKIGSKKPSVCVNPIKAHEDDIETLDKEGANKSDHRYDSLSNNRLYGCKRCSSAAKDEVRPQRKHKCIR